MKKAPTPHPIQARLGPIIVLMAIAQVAKRLGFGRLVARVGLSKILSESRKAKAFRGYAPTKHDVFVATWAKSGTNWMMQIAQQIAWRGDAEFHHIHQLVPWPDAPVESPLPLESTAARDASPTGLRIIKTHLETEFVPYSEEARYLTVIRDPKEVLVSSYWFLGGMLGVLSHITIADWFELFMRPGGMADEWARHTASFWDWRDRPNVLVVRFDEAKRAPRETIARVAETMQVELTAAELDRVTERSSFAWMKAHGDKFDPPPIPFMKDEARPKMVRRGESGASDELLGPEQQRAVDLRCRAALEELGSSFPYSEAFASDAFAG